MTLSAALLAQDETIKVMPFPAWHTLGTFYNLCTSGHICEIDGDRMRVNVSRTRKYSGKDVVDRWSVKI